MDESSLPLRGYVDLRFDDVHERFLEINTRRELALNAVTTQNELHNQHHAREHIATERAIEKAEAAMNARLEGMNEFRKALAEQQSTGATRREVEQMRERLGEHVTVVEFREVRRLVYMGLGMAVLLPILLGIIGSLLLR